MLWNVDHRLLTARRGADDEPLLFGLVLELVLMLGLSTTAAKNTGKAVYAPIAAQIELLSNSMTL